MIDIHDFNAFDSEGGLRRVLPSGCFSVFSGPSEAQQKAEAEIAAFKNLIQNQSQPSFFISSDKWKMLWNGENDNGRWMKDGYEVYGFVFCLALRSSQCFPKPMERTNTWAYFRIRTIIKKKGDNSTGQIFVKVETENIAYVDISEAVQGSPSQVKFLTPADTAVRQIIDSEVIKKGDDNRLQREFFTNINPFVDTTVGKKCREVKVHGVFSNEGGIFGKDRIESILGQYEGTKISIAHRIRPYNSEIDSKDGGGENTYRRELYYHFKMNPEYESFIPCPNPPICVPSNN